MAAIRSVEIALLLSLIITYSFAAPKAVDHDSKVDKLGECGSEIFLLVGQQSNKLIAAERPKGASSNIIRI